MNTSKSNSDGMSTTRIEALTDGIFAFAMTLLVLDLKGIPQRGNSFRQQLQPMLPAFFPYLISFLILGSYWTTHSSEFHFIKRTTRIHLWLNVLLLMFVALIPFSASLLRERKLNQFSVVMYGINLISVPLAYYAQWWYATYKHRLVDENLDVRFIKDVKERILIAILLFLLALGFSFWNTIISLILFLLTQLFYVLKTSKTITGSSKEVEKSRRKRLCLAFYF